MIELFITKMQVFISQDVRPNWWTGVMWIISVFLWCFYQLFGLSFWRHPLTVEDPLVSKWCDAKFLQMCSDEETNSSTSWMAWGRVHFQQTLIFGWTIPLKMSFICYYIHITVSCTLTELLHKLEITAWTACVIESTTKEFIGVKCNPNVKLKPLRI